MNDRRTTVTILMADDDEDDCMLAREALIESQLANDLLCVQDGEELMPRKDGREALIEIKTDPNLRQIPIVVLTTSKAEEDIYRSYNLGANSFITKPVTFESLLEVMQILGKYWFEIVELPLEHFGD